MTNKLYLKIDRWFRAKKSLITEVFSVNVFDYLFAFLSIKKKTRFLISWEIIGKIYFLTFLENRHNFILNLWKEITFQCIKIV